MNMHPRPSRTAPDAACHKTLAFRGHDPAEVDAKRAKRLEDVQRQAPRHLGTFKRAYAGGSLRAAVNAMCVECMGFEASEVARCTATACTLYPYRNGAGGKGAA